jgi:hypothetical protein
MAARIANSAFGIFTDDGLDQTVYTLRDAKREARDLRKMGFKVAVIRAVGDLHRLEDAFERLHDDQKGAVNRIPGPTLMARIGVALGVQLVKTQD